MTGKYILAIDNGTQSVRALVFDLQGNLIAKQRVPIQPYYSDQPGWAEQDPLVYWHATCQACQALWHESNINKNDIAGVGLTTQRSTLINLDAEGNPLRPAMVWLDQRRTPKEKLKPVGGIWGLLFKLSGMTDTVSYLQSEAESNWIRTYQPDLWKKTAKFVFLSGYLTHMLTGKYVDSVGCQVGYVPFDYKKQTWCGKNDWKWDAVPVERNLLVDLVSPASLLGEITPEASEATGIPAGLPLIATAADKATEVIGAGCLTPDMGCLSYGTTATINTTHTKYIEVIPLIPPYPSAVPGAYSLEISVFRGFWMVSWFKDEFGQIEKELAKERHVEVEVLFDDLLKTAPPGSQGLILQPYWSPGLKVPGPEAKGSIIGFGDVHTRAHFYRSILEGLAYSLREGLERTEKRSHIPITSLRVAGGGSQSPGALQITADIFGLPVSKPHVYEASGLGAAIDVAVGLNMHLNFETAVSEMTHIGETYLPDQETHKMYSNLYERVYLKLYKQLKPLYDEIRDITGYPPK
ncbi:MAG: FGGY-family carbohydrate kinase [Anaerolineaceae bacterium]|nr:FGGY-family carbohydrate kinase [Anaerolineaceae bacterium]